MIKVGDLSNSELLARLRAHLGRGNAWLAGLLAYLGEVDARRLYAEQACTSTWDFCVRKLGMSESEAQRRIAAARVVRAFPLARAYLERGQIHLCAIYELYKHITDDNHEELLREAAGKTTKAVGEMIAARFPKPDVHPSIEPLAPQPLLPVSTTLPDAPRDRCSPAPPSPAPPEVRSRVEPLSAMRYRIELTVSRETKDKLERVRDLMRHRNPTGDLERIVDLAVDLLLMKLEKERLGKVSRSKAEVPAVSSGMDVSKCAPGNDTTTTERRADVASAPGNDATSPPGKSCAGAERDGQKGGLDAREALEVPRVREEQESSALAETAAPGTPKPARPARSQSDGLDMPNPLPVTTATRRGHVPRRTRREVFARDGEQCTYVDADGNRCPARGFLELDHVKAKALGGNDEAANLRARCSAHNRLHAEQVFGRDYIEKRIDLRQRKYAAAHAPAFDTAARGLRSLGFREPEVREVIARLATSLDEDVSVEIVIRNALALLT